MTVVEKIILMRRRNCLMAMLLELSEHINSQAVYLYLDDGLWDRLNSRRNKFRLLIRACQIAIEEGE